MVIMVVFDKNLDSSKIQLMKVSDSDDLSE